ncbi:unnamed protein product [Peniophora sp. CBMAI 1063]|nr:unnamed protein product [Peniophora sp. CBMAI 1063]
MASESASDHPGSRDMPSDSGNMGTTLEDGELDFVRDEDFYFNSIVFRAGKTHFKVPAYALPTEDGVFSAMFEFPNKNGEGSSDRNPIRLPEEVTAMDFRSFLKACIPMPDNVEPPKLTVHEWMSVLKLSKMWCLEDLSEQANEGADDEVSAIADAAADGILQKILLGKQYSISRWLLEEYESLGKRDTYLSASERTVLGVETSFRISELREKSWTWAHPRRQTVAVTGVFYAPVSSGESYKDRDGFDYASAIKTIFDSELRMDPSYGCPFEAVG